MSDVLSTVSTMSKNRVKNTEGSQKSDKLDITDITASLASTTLQEKDDNQYTIVDTTVGVGDLITNLIDLPSHPPSLFVDLEGVNLSRHGSISILQIFVRPRNKTYLIDIHTLKEKAFSHALNGSTLKDILESSTIPKVFFDVRNDSDALYSHFKIKLAGVQDLQLMELATRTFAKSKVNGLARCMEHDANMTPSERRKWKDGKKKGLKLFAPERGGSYEVFNIRPLPEDIKQYCVQDVQFLSRLWERYNLRLTPTWRARVEEEVENRILLSQSATFNGKGMHMALAPSGWSTYSMEGVNRFRRTPGRDSRLTSNFW